MRWLKPPEPRCIDPPRRGPRHHGSHEPVTLCHEFHELNENSKRTISPPESTPASEKIRVIREIRGKSFLSSFLLPSPPETKQVEMRAVTAIQTAAQQRQDI